MDYPKMRSSPLEIDEIGTVPTHEPFIESEEKLIKQLAVASTGRLRCYIDKEVRRLTRRQDRFFARCKRREQEEIATRMAEAQSPAATQSKEDVAEEKPIDSVEQQEEISGQPIPPTTPKSSTRRSTHLRSFNTGYAVQALINLAGAPPQLARTPSKNVKRATSLRNPAKKPQPTGKRVSFQPFLNESSLIKPPKMHPMSPPGHRRTQYQQEIEKEHRKKCMNENRQIPDYLPLQTFEEFPELPPPRGRIPTARVFSQVPSALLPVPSTFALRSALLALRLAPFTQHPVPSALRPAPAIYSTSQARTTSSARQSNSQARQSTSQARQSTSQARQSTSQARQSTSQARQSTSQATQTRQSTSQTRQSTSQARQSNSRARQFISQARQSTSQAQCTAPQPAKVSCERIYFDILLDDEDSE